MKKIILGMLLMAATTSAFAQFEEGKKYVGATLSGLNLSYSDSKDFGIGFGGQAGYFIADDIMIVGDLGVDISDWKMQKIHLGAKGRYYFEENGVYCAAGVKYVHMYKNYNDVQLTPEVGYTYFLNQHLTVEPAVYFDMSLTDFGHKSEVGLKVGIGIYF
jgi:hypothetical protein